MSEGDNRGQWQAQGNDMPQPKGLCHPWNFRVAPNKAAGLGSLERLESACEPRQRELRDKAYKKAKLHVLRAPVEGYSAPQMKSFPVLNPPHKAKKARVDLEITTGAAFTGSLDE